jgi:hypothetical protein
MDVAVAGSVSATGCKGWTGEFEAGRTDDVESGPLGSGTAWAGAGGVGEGFVSFDLGISTGGGFCDVATEAG